MSTYADRAALKEEIRRRAPIEDVIGQRITLHREGNLLVGLCPFVTEKTPSFKVDYRSSYPHYHCYSCNAHGDVFAFVMAIEHLDFPAALDWLAQWANMPRVEPQYQPLKVKYAPKLRDVGDGLTLEKLAHEKKLPVEFLKAEGCRNSSFERKPAVLIPYYDVAGKVVACRYRLCLEGHDRFAWRPGDKIMLYGLHRLSDIRRLGWTLLVEGESDCWTAWYASLSALGIPGKSSWRAEWAAYFEGVQTYVWVEPDADSIISKVSSDILNLSVIYAPKDARP